MLLSNRKVGIHSNKLTIPAMGVLLLYLSSAAPVYWSLGTWLELGNLRVDWAFK
jgi:hypothetical protein